MRPAVRCTHDDNHKKMNPNIPKPTIQPYLFFDGRCEEALDFYKGALDAEVLMLLRFKDNPEPPKPGDCPPGAGDKVMHAQFRVGNTFVMASDGRCGGTPVFSGFSLAHLVPTEAAADRTFTALADGGEVMMPLGKTFFSPSFGMLTDRFGVGWMIMTEPSGE